jgi:hypothetical protein
MLILRRVRGQFSSTAAGTMMEGVGIAVRIKRGYVAHGVLGRWDVVVVGEL